MARQLTWRRRWADSAAQWLLLCVSLTVCAGPTCAESRTDPGAGDRSTPTPSPLTPAVSRPRSAERTDERTAMVRTQIEARGVKDPLVLEAMRQVPRHWFVLKAMEAQAYADRPLPIGDDQTISQPYIVALMTEALSLTPESTVLEVGTGSGYQAAVLSEITPYVFTIEIVESLGKNAAAAFEQRGYRTIQARIGDGYAGWPEFAPFDAIVVTCAPDHIPPQLVEQLKPGGRICIPVGDAEGIQELVLVTKQPDGALERKSLIPVRFVPMTGKAQTPGGKRD